MANRSIFVAETLLGGVRPRRRGDNVPPSGGPGAQPRHAFGSFRRDTKGTPGVGRVGPLVGAEAKSDDLLPMDAAPQQRKNKIPPLTGGKNLLYLNRK